MAYGLLYDKLMGQPQSMQMGGLRSLLPQPDPMQTAAVQQQQQPERMFSLANLRTNMRDVLSPEIGLQVAGEMMSGQDFGDSVSRGFSAAGIGIGKKREERKVEAQRNTTRDLLAKRYPDMVEFFDAGLPLRDVWEMTRGGKDDIINAGDGRLYNATTGTWIEAPNGGGNDDFAKRRLAAEQYGLTQDDPAYRSFVLTGKMPREDQAPLTATDKKAILEADEMVAANENAINALEQAERISDDANSGWFAGTRAAVGNNLPDWMVPDAVSSPNSSVATTDMDNAVIGQALASLKTIFGGNPTEGERAILLQLQGSSGMPKDVRKRVFARAKELAKRRLEFNRKRADELRGGTFYKAGGGTSGGANRTSSGLEWSVEP